MHGNTPPGTKKATFQIGGSSGEGDGSSFEAGFDAASLPKGLKQDRGVISSFHTQTIQDKSYESEDGEQPESAIKDEDEDGEEWEDEAEASDAPLVDDRDMFQRVDSRPNLTSRRSLLTSMIHEKDRAAALGNAASRSTPTIRRSRTPNGPNGTSPSEVEVPEAFRSQMQTSRAKPIVMTHSLALSPRTTRRNMLFSELTESVRMNLLWERQARKPRGTKSAVTRRHTSNDVKNLKEFPGDTQPAPYLNPLKEVNSSLWNDIGLHEYHQKGW